MQERPLTSATCIVVGVWLYQITVPWTIVLSHCLLGDRSQQLPACCNMATWPLLTKWRRKPISLCFRKRWTPRLNFPRAFLRQHALWSLLIFVSKELLWRLWHQMLVAGPIPSSRWPAAPPTANQATASTAKPAVGTFAATERDCYSLPSNQSASVQAFRTEVIFDVKEMRVWIRFEWFGMNFWCTKPVSSQLRAILASSFRPGSDGHCGGAIYFAMSPEA